MQTCGYYDAFRGSKTSFSVVSATWHLAPCPPAACAIAHGSGAGDTSPKRPRKYARRLVRMVLQALCHRAPGPSPASRRPTPTKNTLHKDRKGWDLFLFTHLTVERCPFLFITPQKSPRSRAVPRKVCVLCGARPPSGAGSARRVVALSLQEMSASICLLYLFTVFREER